MYSKLLVFSPTPEAAGRPAADALTVQTIPRALGWILNRDLVDILYVALGISYGGVKPPT